FRAPGAQVLRVAFADFAEGEALPGAEVRLAQPLFDLHVQAEAGGDDLCGLAGPGERGVGVRLHGAAAGQGRGDPLGLLAADAGEGGVAAAAAREALLRGQWRLAVPEQDEGGRRAHVGGAPAGAGGGDGLGGTDVRAGLSRLGRGVGAGLPGLGGGTGSGLPGLGGGPGSGLPGLGRPAGGGARGAGGPVAAGPQPERGVAPAWAARTSAPAFPASDVGSVPDCPASEAGPGPAFPASEAGPGPAFPASDAGSVPAFPVS